MQRGSKKKETDRKKKKDKETSSSSCCCCCFSLICGLFCNHSITTVESKYGGMDLVLQSSTVMKSMERVSEMLEVDVVLLIHALNKNESNKRTFAAIRTRNREVSTDIGAFALEVVQAVCPSKQDTDVLYLCNDLSEEKDFANHEMVRQDPTYRFFASLALFSHPVDPSKKTIQPYSYKTVQILFGSICILGSEARNLSPEHRSLFRHVAESIEDYIHNIFSSSTMIKP